MVSQPYIELTCRPPQTITLFSVPATENEIYDILFTLYSDSACGILPIMSTAPWDLIPSYSIFKSSAVPGAKGILATLVSGVYRDQPYKYNVFLRQSLIAEPLYYNLSLLVRQAKPTLQFLSETSTARRRVPLPKGNLTSLFPSSLV
jgi:hypothetical protein